MSRNKKIVAIVTLVLGFVLLTVGVSSALMNYNRIGSNQELVLGDIWMSYEETTALTIEDALPGSDYSNYFEFTISGKNTYTKKDIYYDFSLVRGDLPEGKTEENRIPDKYLKFKLVSVDDSNQETVIFTDETYESLENQRIYVETIAKNTTSEVNRKYRLYMTIDYSLEIGNLETAVFTHDEWESAFASVKLNVTGDFIEKKTTPTYEDCFDTSTNYDGTLNIKNYYKYNANSTDELYRNPLCTSDVVIPSTIKGMSVTKIGADAFYFDELTSVEIPDSITSIGAYAFSGNELTSVEIPDSVTSIGTAAFNRNKFSDSEAFIYSRTDNNNDGIAEIDTTTLISYGGENLEPVIPEGVVTIGYRAFFNNSLTGIVISSSVENIGNEALYTHQPGAHIGSVYDHLSDNKYTNYIRFVKNLSGNAFNWEEIFLNDAFSIISAIGNNYFDYGAFTFNFGSNIKKIYIDPQTTPENCFGELESSVSTEYTIITDYDISCGTDVVIPSLIDNTPVTIIDNAFIYKGITSVYIPSSVKTIQGAAFFQNNLTTVKIPDSVVEIGDNAFALNYLTEVELGKSVSSIGRMAFATHSNYYAGGSLITNVINKSGNEFDWDNIFGTTSSDGNNYFSTGKYKTYYQGQIFEILISDLPLTSESCFSTETDEMEDGTIRVIDYDFSCGSDVVIPYKINDKIVAEIGNKTFYNKGITSITIPDGVKIISDYAFQGNNLVNIVIPDSVTTIGWHAFEYNSLQKVVLGSSVQTIGRSAFPVGSASVGGNNIKKVINKSGNEFDWNDIFNVTSTDGNNVFATGTYKFYYNGDQTIEITDVDVNEDEGSGEE